MRSNPDKHAFLDGLKAATGLAYLVGWRMDRPIREVTMAVGRGRTMRRDQTASTEIPNSHLTN